MTILRGASAALLVGVAVSVCTARCATARPKKHEATNVPLRSAGAAWDDPQRCETAIAAGARLTRAELRVRLATWNIKWFPDGKPGKGETTRNGGTDIAWLACALTWLDADVVALQEVKQTPRAQEALAALTSRLGELTGAKWSWLSDRCPDPYKQRLTYLYRDDRVSLTLAATHGELDPTAAPDGTPECPGFLRPALGAYVKSKRGGLDFHLLDVHLDSGPNPRDYEHRRFAWAAFETITKKRQALYADTDVVVGGDFNTMGCKSCGVADGVAEQRELTDLLAKLTAPFVVVKKDLACTQYYRGKASVLDHWLVSATMQEAANASATVSGVCAGARCQDVDPDRQAAIGALSDHCPTTLDLVDEDRD